jgi:limonene-1,2-epoxide hydrolase
VRTPAETVGDFVSAFIEAWPDGDASTLAGFFSDDAVYHNGPLAPVHGREAVVAALASMMELGGDVGVDITHLVAEGSVVMTERVDHWKDAEHTATLRVAGICEVHDGVITAWRDYFDPAEFTAQVAGGG